jgi:hypothetical protein
MKSHWVRVSGVRVSGHHVPVIRQAGTCFLIVLAVLGASPACGGGSPPDPEQVRAELQSIHTIDRQIACLEQHPERDSHLVRHILASLYIRREEADRAAELLREDLRRTKDCFDAYESYTLLIGLHLDLDREMPEWELRRFERRFRRLQGKAVKEIGLLERATAGLEERAAWGDEDSRRQARLLHARRRRVEAYSRDELQYDRMMGDYRFRRGDLDRAYRHYDRYFTHPERAAGSVVLQSLRAYIDLLLMNNETSRALLFQGYLVNLEPHLFEDLLRLAELYHLAGDPTSALFTVMLANAAAECRDPSYSQHSRLLVSRLASERGVSPPASRIARVYLEGGQAQAVPGLIRSLREQGCRHVFFHYLTGLSRFIEGAYEDALSSFSLFNAVYPHLADAQYFCAVCLHRAGLDNDPERIARCCERAVQLKPGSPVAMLSRRFLGGRLGLDDQEIDRMLLPFEVQAVLEEFTGHGVPADALAPLIEALAVSPNPYQAAQVQLMGGVRERRGEYIAFLEENLERVNTRGRRNLERVLSLVREGKQAEAQAALPDALFNPN